MEVSRAPWQPLSILNDQFNANLDALRSRDSEGAGLADALETFAPADQLLIAAEGERLILGARSRDDAQVRPFANPVTAGGAGQIAAKLYPSGKCTEPVFVAGLDQGWLWSALYNLPVHTPHAPGHTPALYFVATSIERLWIVLHIQDWQQMLAAPRVRLFAGSDAVPQAQQSMAENLNVPFPKLCVTVDPTTWTNGASIDTVTGFALQAAGARINQLKARIDRAYATADPGSFFASGRKLRVMGITSRFTTFLQYSMRDWLEAFESLGHETHLVIEPHDCAQANPIMFAEACASFRPDLIVMIDHYRGEYSSLPENVPFVMWIQDQLPNMFRAQAGAAQKRYDYTIGYGRVNCVYDYGYPSDRFMPAMVGTNEKRFHPRRLTTVEYTKHACDVSFVSHCSTPAEVALQQEIARQGAAETRKLFELTFEKLRARYDLGRAVTMPSEFRQMVDSALGEMKLAVDRPNTLLNIFTHKINNALFRHQALEWLIELAERDGLRVHLYGRGWESHPKFAAYARGVADNESELSAIYQASKINLQISPFGSAHQRVFDGLCASGFFLLRACPGDRVDRIFRNLWNWIRSQRSPIVNEAQLQASARHEPHVQQWIDELTLLGGQELFGQRFDFVTELEVTASDGFSRNAATLWDEYDEVAFDTRDDLYTLVRRFVVDDAARATIARSMRERVVERMTYRAIAQRTIDFVRRDLAISSQHSTIAA